MEREEAFTFHLKAIGAYLPPAQSEISLTEGHFAYEASVIIPVRIGFSNKQLHLH